MKYHLWTIGCQYNEWDGARIRYILDSLGFQETSAKDAEAIIILACAVRQTAVDRALGRIKNWIPFRKNSAVKKAKNVIVTGCVLDSDKKKFTDKGVKVVKARDYKTLLKLLDKNATISSKLLKASKSNSKFIPIINGCNNFCSYCAVPYTRGREKSRPMDEILDDAKVLINKGERDIMLLGQNVNSYAVRRKERGERGKEKTDFTILLEKLNALEGDFMISFISSHPKDMTDDITEAVATLPKIKKEIHLPFQSGSNKVLKSMNRPYTIEKYLDILKKIRKISKKHKVNIKLSTDVLVGFPGESENDFQQTVEVLKKVNFNYVFINKYSPRAGTEAYKLGDPILWPEKQRRWRILNGLINR